jgi:hypothetical protein
MKKVVLVLAGAAIAGGFLAARRNVGGGVDLGRLIEAMPDNAPPKWMFNNITAIRQNTERIVAMLETDRAARSA